MTRSSRRSILLDRIYSRGLKRLIGERFSTVECGRGFIEDITISRKRAILKVRSSLCSLLPGLTVLYSRTLLARRKSRIGCLARLLNNCLEERAL